MITLGIDVGGTFTDLALWDARRQVLAVFKLSRGDAGDALESLDREDVEAVAVCFLYSFVDATHERLAGAEIRERLPGCFVSLSAEVSPEFREYERLSTTVANAYLGPLVSR